MPIQIKVSLKHGVADIEKEILRCVRTELGKAIKSAAPSITQRIQGVCEKMITDTVEYKSLLSGELLAELGIPDVERRLRQILETIKQSVQVKAKPLLERGNQIQGGIEISLLRSDFADILGLSASQYVSNSTYLIPWLSWLITEGDRIIVATHDVTYRLSPADRARSRTGLALMRPSGHGWRVPPQFSGTESSNFLTRAFDGDAIKQYISQIVEEEIQRRL